jgi:HrpA-like RNA helicase
MLTDGMLLRECLVDTEVSQYSNARMLTYADVC